MVLRERMRLVNMNLEGLWCCDDLPPGRRTECIRRLEHGARGVVRDWLVRRTSRFSRPTTLASEERCRAPISSLLVPVKGVTTVEPSPKRTTGLSCSLCIHRLGGTRFPCDARPTVSQCSTAWRHGGGSVHRTWSWTLGSCPQNLENSCYGLAAEDVGCRKNESGQLAWDAPSESRCGQSHRQSKPTRSRGRSRTRFAGKLFAEAPQTHQDLLHDDSCEQIAFADQESGFGTRESG